MKQKILDIFLRRLDSYVNPKIENRVIYSTLLLGVALVASPWIVIFFSSISIESNGFNINIQGGKVDNISLITGFILILISAVTLYIFRIHKRPEFIIESDSAIAGLWEKHGYSFQKETLVNPLLLKDLVGLMSDSGRQVVSIDIHGANSSNRYFGEVVASEVQGKSYIEVRGEDGREVFGYEYLGTSESGIHVVHAYERTGGSATFHWILLLQIEESTFLDYACESPNKIISPVLKLVGRIPLGDRYTGCVSMNKGLIYITKDRSHLPDHLIDTQKRILVK